jgi:hypothetical protein
MPPDRLRRAVLLAPDAIAHRAAGLADDAEERWMLRRPRAVRRSFVADVLAYDQQDVRQQLWMLRQDDELRESYARDVLLPRLERGARAVRPDG